MVGALASSASAQSSPAQMSVTVVAPSGTRGPAPTGEITVSLDGRKIATVPLTSATNPITTATPLLSGALKLLGREVTITYSGDSNYEASDGATVTFPTSTGLTIVAKPRDDKPPVIEILSPGDGVNYARLEPVLALYTCRPSDIRVPVIFCAANIPPGLPLNTIRAGSFTFQVRARDALNRAATKTVSYTVGGAVADPAAPAPPPPPAAASPPPPAAPTEAMEATAVIAAAAEPAAAPATSAQGRRSAASRGSAPAGSKPAPRAQTKPAGQEYGPYDPRSEPVKSVGILVTMFTLLQLAGAGGGLARGGGGANGSGSAGTGAGGSEDAAGKGDGESSGAGPSMDYEGIDIAYLGAGMGAVALGDRSRTWMLPGTRAIDALGVAVPARLARRSPLLARLTADGTYLRAILGSGSVLTIAAALALGVLALRDTGGDAVPPVAALAIAIAVLGVLDATAGLTAVLVFMIGTFALGGVESGNDLRLLLGLSALWCIVPVLAGAVRPLRRQRVRGAGQWWDRVADFVVASLIGAWAVQKIVLSLPGLAGVELPITEHANLAAYCVLAALSLRLGLETIAAHLYPQRLNRTEPELADPDALQRLCACAVRATIFVFFAYIVVGMSWQLWVGAALFVIPQVLGVFEERFPNSAALYKVLPKGLVELVLMLFVGTAVGALLIGAMDENAESFLATCFVLLSLPGFALSLAQLLGRDGAEPEIGWGKRLGGVLLVVVGVMLVLGMIL